MTIFALPGHIEQIKTGLKTQTRRLVKDGTGFTYDDNGCVTEVRHNGRLQYAIGRVYSATPGRGKKTEARFKVTAIRVVSGFFIDEDDALAEGLYTPNEYRDVLRGLYGKLPDAMYALTFEVVV